MLRVRALDDFYYDGDRKRGDQFEVNDDVVAKMLEMNQKVKIIAATTSMKATTNTDEQSPTKQQRGRYRRADLRADE